MKKVNISKNNQKKIKHEHRMAKGTIYLMIAQVIFLGSGYVIHFELARMVSAEEYGRFGVILSLLLLTQVFLGRGVPEAVTKYIAEGRDVKEVFKKGMKIQIIFSFIIFFLIVILSPLLANILNDKKLTTYIIIIAFLIPIRGTLNIYRGFFTGLRQFNKVVINRVLNVILKVPLALIFIYIGLSVPGAILGYIIAAILVLLLYIKWIEIQIPGKMVSYHDLIYFSFPIIIFSISYLFISNIDLFFVKSILESDKAGYYTAARTIGYIPYLASTALTFTLLPSIAKSYSEKNDRLTTSYIENSYRYTLMLIVPITVLIGIMSSKILTLFYPNDYKDASLALSIFIIGISFLVFFIISGTILMAIGKQKIPMRIGLLLVILSFILNYWLINIWDMNGAAFSTTITCLIGMIVSLFYVKQIFGIIMSVRSFVNIIISISPSLLLGYCFAISGLFIILWIIILFLIYVGMLFLIKEINKEDIDIMKSFVSRK